MRRSSSCSACWPPDAEAPRVLTRRQAHRVRPAQEGPSRRHRPADDHGCGRRERDTGRRRRRWSPPDRLVAGRQLPRLFGCEARSLDDRGRRERRQAHLRGRWRGVLVHRRANSGRAACSWIDDDDRRRVETCGSFRGRRGPPKALAPRQLLQPRLVSGRQADRLRAQGMDPVQEHPLSDHDGDVDSDGNDRQVVTKVFDSSGTTLTWSPDGELIAFTDLRDDQPGLWTDPANRWTGQGVDRGHVPVLDAELGPRRHVS